MNTTKKANTGGKQSRISLGIIFLFLYLVFFFMMSIAMAPYHKKKEVEALVLHDSLFVTAWDTTWNHTALSKDVKMYTYVQAKLKQAISDSIQLTVNLADSTVYLSISGVKIHCAPITHIEQDSWLDHLAIQPYVKLFSQPLVMKSSMATIMKEPVVVRQAPKDTLEAAANAWKPDTLVQNAAFVKMELEHGLTLVFEQDRNSRMGDSWIHFTFAARVWIQTLFDSLSRFCTLQHQEYHPTIRIKMPVEDLRAVYRAIPHHPEVVLHLE